MLREAKNSVTIEGILSEIDLQERTYEKNGEMREAVSGTIKIKVPDVQITKNLTKTLEVVGRVFANKYTNAGKLNASYESIMRVKNEMVSIAAAGSEDGATCIRIAGRSGRLQNVEYPRDGRIVSFPGVNVSFVSKINREQMKPRAEFAVEMMLKSIAPEIDANGEETGRLKIKGAVPGYNNTVQAIDFYAAGESRIDYIVNDWQINDTVYAEGILYFTSETQDVPGKKLAFGESAATSRTISVSDLLIMGCGEPMTGDFAFDKQEIDAGLADHQATLDNRLSKAENKVDVRKPTRNIRDLGF